MVGVERSEDGKRIAGAVWRGQGGEERVDTELIVGKLFLKVFEVGTGVDKER